MQMWRADFCRDGVMGQRKARFTENGLTALTYAVMARRHILFSTGVMPGQVQERLHGWREVVRLVNAEERTTRTWEECRKKVYDLRKSARMKLAYNHAQMGCLDGRPSNLRELSSHERRILEMFGPEPVMGVGEWSVELEEDQSELQAKAAQQEEARGGGGGEEEPQEGSEPFPTAGPRPATHPGSMYSRARTAGGGVTGAWVRAGGGMSVWHSGGEEDEEEMSVGGPVGVVGGEEEGEDLEGGEPHPLPGQPVRRLGSSRAQARALPVRLSAGRAGVGAGAEERGVGPVFRRQMLRQGDDTVQLLIDMNAAVRSGLAPVQRCAEQLPEALGELRHDLVEEMSLLRDEMRCGCSDPESQAAKPQPSVPPPTPTPSPGLDTQALLQAVDKAIASAASTLSDGLSQALAGGFAALGRQVESSMAAGFRLVAEASTSTPAPPSPLAAWGGVEVPPSPGLSPAAANWQLPSGSRRGKRKVPLTRRAPNNRTVSVKRQHKGHT